MVQDCEVPPLILWGFTFVCVAMMFAHLFIPSITIDNITIVLLVIALIPHILKYFDELPTPWGPVRTCSTHL